MASNREERFLMRQRGAGARQLRNSGFDFDLPGVLKSPLKPILSGKSRRTPKSNTQALASTKRTPKVTTLLPQRLSRRTPASRTTQNSQNPSSRQLTSILEHQDVLASEATKTDEQGSVTKKRKLAGSRSVNSSSIHDEPRDAASVFGRVPERSKPFETESQRQIVESESSTATPGKKRRKRKSIGQKAKKRARTSLHDEVILASQTPTTALAEPSKSETRSDLSELETGQARDSQVAVQVESPKRRKKKRKSIGAPKTKRNSLVPLSILSRDVGVSLRESSPGVQQSTGSRKLRRPRKELASLQEESEDKVAKEAPKTSSRVGKQRASTTPSSSTQPRRRGRPKKSDTSASAFTTTAVSKTTTTKPKTQKPYAKPHVSSSIIDPSEPPQPRRKPGTVPITVHRIAHAKCLKDDLVYEDILSIPAPFPKKGGVNAIDVLSQICRETIAKSIETLKQNADNEPSQQQKAEWRRKSKAVKMFGDELDTRLFQMTEALDNNHGLVIRLRQANKTKTAKRDTLLDIKRQREEIAIEMDAVRAQHEKATKIAQDENDLDTMIQDIELAVQRGRAAQLAKGEEEAGEEGVGLELRLRKLAAEVSSVGGGGLLERVRGFNALMEKSLSGV